MKKILALSLLAVAIFAVGCNKAEDPATAPPAGGKTVGADKNGEKGPGAGSGQATLGPGAGGADQRAGAAGKG